MEFVENYKGCVINRSPVGGRWADGVWLVQRFDYSIFFPDGTVSALDYHSADGARAEIDKRRGAPVVIQNRFDWFFSLNL